MKQIVFYALAFISFNAYSAWDKTGQSDGFMTYVDTSTIKRNGSPGYLQ